MTDATEKVYGPITNKSISGHAFLEPKHDPVLNPSHYDLIPEKNVQVIDVIRATLTEEEFTGYCKGNRIKYSLRGGKKDGESEIKDASKARTYIDFQLN